MDGPSVGTLYRCEGVFICYGDHFGLTPTLGCADSLEDAHEEFYQAAMELTQEAKCGDSWEIITMCESEGDKCQE